LCPVRCGLLPESNRAVLLQALPKRLSHSHYRIHFCCSVLWLVRCLIFFSLLLILFLLINDQFEIEPIQNCSASSWRTCNVLLLLQRWKGRLLSHTKCQKIVNVSYVIFKIKPSWVETLSCTFYSEPFYHKKAFHWHLAIICLTFSVVVVVDLFNLF
jgi:hypothetical protein